MKITQASVEFSTLKEYMAALLYLETQDIATLELNTRKQYHRVQLTGRPPEVVAYGIDISLYFGEGDLTLILEQIP